MEGRCSGFIAPATREVPSSLGRPTIRAHFTSSRLEVTLSFGVLCTTFGLCGHLECRIRQFLRWPWRRKRRFAKKHPGGRKHRGLPADAPFSQRANLQANRYARDKFAHRAHGPRGERRSGSCLWEHHQHGVLRKWGRRTTGPHLRLRAPICRPLAVHPESAARVEALEARLT